MVWGGRLVKVADDDGPYPTLGKGEVIEPFAFARYFFVDSQDDVPGRVTQHKEQITTITCRSQIN